MDVTVEKVIVIDSDEDDNQSTEGEKTWKTPLAEGKFEVFDGSSSQNGLGTLTPQETLNFSELMSKLDVGLSKTTEATKSTKKKGPICCNSWCFNPASSVPEENIRDYYSIPPGKNYKICDKCLNSYHSYVITAQENLTSGGNMLEGRCPMVNEFIIIDNESDDEGDSPECANGMNDLLGDAINEIMVDLDKEVQLKTVYDRSKEQILTKLENFVDVSVELAKTITKLEVGLYSDFESFKDVFKQKKGVVEEMDVPIEEFEDTMDDEGFTEEESTKIYLEGLPSFGFLKKPPLRVGGMCYAARDSPNSDWIPFLITDISISSDERGQCSESYEIEVSISDSKIKKAVVAEGLAYHDPSEVRFYFGCRVIGAFNHNRGDVLPKYYYPGMIAELPTELNRYRYLIFFDNGKFQYCKHSDVRAIYRTYKKLHEYFYGFQSEFVFSYLNRFPERIMVLTVPSEYVRIELNGFWISAKVERVDASLARVFYANDQRAEWIYRGSPRLRPVYDRLKSQINRPRNQVPVIRPIKRRGLSSNSANTAPQIVIDSSDDDEEEAPRQVGRAVAKKSTTSQNHTALRGDMRSTTRASILRKMPLNALVPNTFHWHKCSLVCVTWVKYSEDKTEGVHPLAIPSLFAFRREIDVTSAVSYTAPCGKRLKNIQEVLKYLSETFIPLTLDMFDFDIRTQIFDEYVVAPKYILMEDISFGGERNHIPCINEIDNECPDLMSYMTERRPLEGVNINLDPGFLVCCDCEDNCRDRSKCRCWRLTVDCFKPFNVGDDKRHITKIGYQYQRLDQSILSGIYECNSQCKCNPVTCINRVAQHQTRHKLQLFKTPKKGWGTRCVNDIPQGVFICTYVGNILTEPSANETGTINGDEYFAELDHIEVMARSKACYEAEAAKITDDEDEEDGTHNENQYISGSSNGRHRARRSCTLSKQKRNSPHKEPSHKPKDSQEHILVSNSDSEEETDTIRKFYGPNESVYVMDAKIAGNIGRYFNHSCDPNIFVQNVYVDTHDLRFPWIAFFALKHIPAGTELTWDYGYSIGSVPGKILYCHCGSPFCKKRLL